MANIHTGGCHCGQLRYQLSGPLQDIAHCHCSICRRVSGGIVTTWITVPASAFQWLAGKPARYDSSPTCARYFCGNCGAQLALVTHLSPDSLDVTIATPQPPEQAPAQRPILAPSPTAPGPPRDAQRPPSCPRRQAPAESNICAERRGPRLHLDEHLPGEAEETL